MKSRTNRLLLVAIAAITLVPLIVSCKKDSTGPKPTPPSVELLIAPTALLSNIDSFYVYWVRVNDGEADSVHCIVRTPAGGLDSVFALFDDGGTTALWGPAYASATSRDVTANNGVFTRAINAHALTSGVAGNYTLRFAALRGGQVLATAELPVAVQNAEPCLITSAPTQAAFATCFAATTLDVRVTHSPEDAVDSVWVNLLSGTDILNRERFAAQQGDTLWRLTLDPTFFGCANGSSLSLTYNARTRFGFACEQTVPEVSYTNQLPQVNQSVMPDTIFHPTVPGLVDTVVVTVNLQDCELQGDTLFYGVKFSIRRHDRVNWTDSLAYFLRDNGVAPDSVAGNGVYSTGLTFNYQVPDSLYYFRFYAIDCAAPFDTSEFLIDSVQFAPRTGALAVRTEPAGDVPFGVVRQR